MPAVEVMGTQWGDEGKGKIVDYLAQQADVVVRYQGGSNAGHTVSVNGEEKTFVVLGEWDNEPSLGIISSGTKLAANLLGRKPGDAVELADADGNAVAATVVRVMPLSDELKAWIKG